MFECWCGNRFYIKYAANNCTHTFEELPEDEKDRRIEFLLDQGVTYGSNDNR